MYVSRLQLSTGFTITSLKDIITLQDLRIDADLIYGKMIPSVFTMYNFTSRDLLIIPEVKFKPADGFSITAGAEIYSGMKGSLFDIVNGFMNSVYLSLRVDF